MKIAVEAARAWLTRSFKPFRFTDACDESLSYADCENLGLYVHIPFCKSICNFCPYCKVLYDPAVCDRYLDALIAEIRQVGAACPGKKKATSLYFGGGTPALAADRLHEVIAALKAHFTIEDGIGAELHPENVTVPVLEKLKCAGVTRISIGIQSFSAKFQAVLGRKPVSPAALQAALAAVPFETVSMDFIFALPGQTVEDLKQDIETAFAIGANHFALYPFIDFTFTASPVRAMKKREKHRLLDQITAYCAARGLKRDSIWTFSSTPGARYSSMTRENFLGFGCSATTLLRDQFKINTFSVEEYGKRVESGRLPSALTIRFTRRQRMVYFLFWAAYTTRVRKADFERFFGVSLRRAYGAEFLLARLLGFVTYRDGAYTLTPRGAFYYHHYENYYTLAYIDKMWGILRQEPFPREIVL